MGITGIVATQHILLATTHIMGERKVNNENLDQPARCIRAACQHRCLFTCDRPRLTLDDPDMGDWSYTYDALGNLTSQTDARSCTTTLAYDVLNRVTDKTYGTGCPTTSTVSYTYDAGTNGMGQRTGMTDGSGSTIWTYDARGRVLTETRNITGSGSFKTQWTYNSADQVKTIRYPSNNTAGLGETVTYTYLPQMALDTVIGTNPYVSDTKYDYAGRITTRTLSSSSFRQNYTYVGWTSIGSGRLDTLKTGTNANDYNNLQDLDYDYDDIGNIISIENFRNSSQAQCFSYDSMDRLVSSFTGSSTVPMDPSVCQHPGPGGNGAYQESYGYDNTTGNLQNKAGAEYTYGDADHAHAVTQIDDGAVTSKTIIIRARKVSNLGLMAGGGIEPVGPVMQLYIDEQPVASWTVGTSSYYNFTTTQSISDNERIDVVCTNCTLTSGLDIDYVSVGSHSVQAEGSATMQDNGSGAAAFDWQNTNKANGYFSEPGALRFVVGSRAFAGHYDANGNLTHRLVNNAATIMSYDAENRLVQVSGATTATFVYNGDGERVRSTVNGTTTAFIGSILEWTGSTTTMIRYYYAGAARIAMRTGTGDPHQYILSDHLGSTSVITSSTGVYQSEVLYKPWGETRWTSGTLPTKYTYTGQYSNVADFGLMYYNARWYDPSLSRFAQADTIVPLSSQGVQAWDRYAGMNNNPIKYIDPSGHMVACDKDDWACQYHWDYPVIPPNDDKYVIDLGKIGLGSYRSYTFTIGWGDILWTGSLDYVQTFEDVGLFWSPWTSSPITNSTLPAYSRFYLDDVGPNYSDTPHRIANEGVGVVPQISISKSFGLLWGSKLAEEGSIAYTGPFTLFGGSVDILGIEYFTSNNPDTGKINGDIRGIGPVVGASVPFPGEIHIYVTDSKPILISDKYWVRALLTLLMP